jgi:hypothetical protein
MAVKQAIGHGVRAKRSKSGAVSFDVLDEVAAHAQVQCIGGGVSRGFGEGPGRTCQSKKVPDRDDPDRMAGGAQLSLRALSSGLDIVRKTLGQHQIRLRPHCRYGQSLANTFFMHVAHFVAGRDLGGPLRLRHDNCAA